MVPLNVLISVFFRLTLIGYGILILLIQPNFFSKWIYVTGIIIYFCAFIYFKRNNSATNTFLRLIIDYAFILFLLYGKIPSFINLCFILLPIINSSNYTGKYGFFASLKLYLIAFVVIYVFYDFNFNEAWLVPLIAFWSLSLLSKFREYIKRLELLLSNPVSQININQISYQAIDKRIILNDIIKEFNQNDIFKIFGLKIKDVVCFKVKAKGASILTASYIVKDFNINNKNIYSDFIQLDKNNFSELEININSIEKKANNRFIVGLKKSSTIYLFCIEFATAPLLFLLPYVKKVFLFTFNNLANVFEIENSLKQRRLKLVKDLKQQALYIEQSTNNIHFINNKLSPILQYLTLRGDIQSGAVKANAEIVKIFNDLELRSKRNIQMIASRSIKQLDKQANPFYNHPSEEITIEQIGSSVSSAWTEAGLNPNDVFFSIKDESSLSKKINFQFDYFEVVIDEIIENMLKHGSENSKYGCICSISDKAFMLVFTNSIADNQIEKINQLSLQFNGDQVSEMLKRTSHGMAMLKSYLIHLNFESNIILDGEGYNLVVSLNF